MDEKARQAALKLLYADEVRYHYLIRHIESAAQWSVFVDDTDAPSAVMLLRGQPSSSEVLVMARHFAGLHALMRRLPHGRVDIEADAPWIAHQIGLHADVRALVPFVRMSVRPEDFRPRPDDRVESFDPSMNDAFARCRLWSDPVRIERAFEQAVAAQAAWVVICDGCLVSKCDVLRRTRRCSEVNEVITDPAFRGEGLATAVVSAATERLISNDRIPIYTTTAGNVPSLRLAQTLGYRPVADTVRFRTVI